MKKFDLIACTHFEVATGLYGKVLGVVDEVKADKFTFNVLHSNYDGFPAYSSGAQLEVGKYKYRWIVNDIAFPYDYTGCMLYGHAPSDIKKFREPYLLLNKKRFVDLLNYLKKNQNKNTFDNLICKFMEIGNWDNEWFLQGVTKE